MHIKDGGSGAREGCDQIDQTCGQPQSHPDNAAVLFTADRQQVPFAHIYRGHTAFLICSGPSLVSHNLQLLNDRGILTCAVNNAAAIVRPNLWVGLDDPGSFCDAIWGDPGITKFVPMAHMEKRYRVWDERNELTESQEPVSKMPSVFGFHTNDVFHAENWLSEATFNCGSAAGTSDEYGNAGSRSVMLVAIKLLYYLGIRKLFLLGCDFHMNYRKQNYAFRQHRTRRMVRGNNRTYRILNVRLKHLRPYFEEQGYQVFNCTPNSGLTAFPTFDYEAAVDMVRANIPSDILTEGMYDQRPRQEEATR